MSETHIFPFLRVFRKANDKYLLEPAELRGNGAGGKESCSP